MDSVHVLEYTFNIQPGSLPLCLSLHFLLVQNLTVCQRWGLKAFSGLLWACVYPQSHTCKDLSISRNMMGFQSSLLLSQSPGFLFEHLVSLLFVLLLIHHLRHPRKLPLIVITFWVKKLHAGWIPNSITCREMCEWNHSGNRQTGQKWIVPWNGALKELQTHIVFSSGCQAMSLKGYCRAGGGRMGS